MSGPEHGPKPNWAPTIFPVFFWVKKGQVIGLSGATGTTKGGPHISLGIAIPANEKIKKDMTKEFLKFYENNLVVETKLLKGVEKFLLWAKSNNISMGVCTNKQEHIAIELLKKINIYDFFEYVAGGNTFDYCKPDPRHITNIIDILQGNIKKSLMIGDSEVDSMAAGSADIPFILVEDGYTDKNINQIPHKHLIKDFVGIEKIVSNYLNDNT